MWENLFGLIAISLLWTDRHWLHRQSWHLHLIDVLRIIMIIMRMITIMMMFRINEILTMEER